MGSTTLKGTLFGSGTWRLLVEAVHIGHTQASACLYKSASGAWGDIVSAMTTDAILSVRSSMLFF